MQTFFTEPLPLPEALGDLLTFHAWELEELRPKPDLHDTVLDIKVLPDKNAWALSHRGIAYEIATLLGRTLAHDPFMDSVLPFPQRPAETRMETANCDRYTLARIDGVVVSESPQWLKDFLVAIGQRSINNIVDATNYVLYTHGQPTHVFDAAKVSGITVRAARDGEEITVLGGAVCTLTADDTVITDNTTGAPLAVGGVKGGIQAELTAATTSVLVESAHFAAVPTRKTAQRLKLRTDASIRYENGIVADVAPIGLRECVKLITEIAGGACTWYEDSAADALPQGRTPVTLSYEKLARILGFIVPKDAIASILTRMRYEHTLTDTDITLVPPFWRTDITIPEDIAEEIVRIYGLAHVPAIAPTPVPLTELNKRFYYAEKIRTALVAHGFSEIYTSSFRKKDQVELQNALASDKTFLRSSLRANMDETLAKNAPLCDLLGVREIRAFEIGTVFTPENEHFSICLGVRGPSGFKAKTHTSILSDGLSIVRKALGDTFSILDSADGMFEINLDALISMLPMPTAYPEASPASTGTYTPFSIFPAVSRDIAFWANDGLDTASTTTLFREHAGEHLVRIDLVDTFSKDGRTSYAFRFVFQASDKTLTDEEVNADMAKVYAAATATGFETR